MNEGLTVVVWLALAAALVLAEAGATRAPGGARLGRVVDAVVATVPGRVAAYLTWVWVGWHVFVRSTPG